MITETEYKQLTKEQREQVKQQINSRMGDYLINRCGISNPARSGNFECPICHHKEMHYYPDTNKVRCFSGKGCHDPQPYDLIDLIGKLHNINGYNDKLFTAINETGVSIPAVAGEGKAQGNSPAPANKQGAAAQPAADQQQSKPNTEGIKNFVRQSAAAMTGSRGESYMIDRGFDPSFLQEMRIGYDSYYDAVVIPYSKEPDKNLDYYFMRYIVPKVDKDGKKIKGYKPKGITEPIFHADNLSNGMPYVFICEGQINALSIEQVGGNAIAIGSSNNGKKLLDYINQLQSIDPGYRSKKTFIVSFDNDTAGKAAEKKLIADLKDAGFIAMSSIEAGLYDPIPELSKPVNDTNDLLVGDPTTLTARIEKMISSPADVYRDSYSMGSFRSEYQRQRIENNKAPRISTGFKHLDEVLGGGLRPSLIFLGAITSIGKTTLIMQMADSIAKQGRDVLIFALEMSRFELVSRSISRESFRIAKAMQTPQESNALTYYEISDGQPLTAAKTNILKQAEDYYFRAIAPHVFIVEGEGQVTADFIRDQVQQHTELTGAAPVVIVDYLQLMQPPKDAIRLSDKQVVDINTMALKHISRDSDFRTPVIAVMSLNRAAYNDDVNLASGKESGATEYGCDILLGMNQEKENDNGTRSIYIDVLKHRGGIKDRRVTFTYTPAYSSFKDNAAMRIPKKKDQGIKKKDNDSNEVIKQLAKLLQQGSSAAATQQTKRKGTQDADGFVIG